MIPQAFYKVFQWVSDLPAAWDELNQNIFLQTSYLKAQETALPENMEILYIAFYQDEQLVGKCIFQKISINKEIVIQKKNVWQKLIGSLFNAQLLCIGNIKVTGNNAYEVNDNIQMDYFFGQLHLAIEDIVKMSHNEGKKIQFILIKDFYACNINPIHSYFKNYNQFAVEPNMIFKVKHVWDNFDDYVSELKSKYRTRLHRALKKSEGIIFKELNLIQIKENQEALYHLYLNVLENIDFSFYTLPTNYFYAMKFYLKENFRVFAGYENGKMLCFYTVIHNHNILETGFLGYDETLQHSKQLYLNMLYKMIAYGIENQFNKIIFSRSALEIKSSVGAEPMATFGLLKHTNYFMNKSSKMIFNSIYDEKQWIVRNPFKA